MELEPSRVEERFGPSDAYNGLWGVRVAFSIYSVRRLTPQVI